VLYCVFMSKPPIKVEFEPGGEVVEVVVHHEGCGGVGVLDELFGTVDCDKCHEILFSKIYDAHEVEE
jgi:hypothetical protein